MQKLNTKMENDRLKFQSCGYYSDTKRGKDRFAVLFVTLTFAFLWESVEKGINLHSLIQAASAGWNLARECCRINGAPLQEKKRGYS